MIWITLASASAKANETAQGTGRNVDALCMGPATRRLLPACLYMDIYRMQSARRNQITLEK